VSDEDDAFPTGAWELPEELVALRATVRRVISRWRGEHGGAPQVDGWVTGWDPALSRELAGQGLVGTAIPVEYGGQGRDVRTLLAVVTEIARRSHSLSGVFWAHTAYVSLNIASAGMGGEVAARVNRSKTRRPWTFLAATVATLLRYQPRTLKIALDGVPWFDGSAYFAAIANGTTFGHGMKIAPKADIHDGLFDIVLLENISRLRILMALRRVYDGSHLTRPEIHYAQAKEVRITSGGAPISLELDGEVASGHELTFQVRPAALQLLT